MSSTAVRFGRIPKREKQRLLDEMQSYMNSLNESAAMEMDPSASCMRDNTSSPDDGNSKEAIGAISRAYRDIFTTSNSTAQERAAKRANISTNTNTTTTTNNNNNTPTFSQDANFSSHPTPAQTYQSCPVAHASLCPVAPNDNQQTFHSVDNERYTYLVSSNQNHDQSARQRSNSAGFHNAGNTQTQTSCPWKLAQGAKVLVSTGGTLNSM